MITDQLLTYIKEQIAQGRSRAEIEAALSASGWDVTDIAAGFEAVYPGAPTTPKISTPSNNAQSEVDAEVARIQAELATSKKRSPYSPAGEVQTGETGIVGWMIRKNLVASKNQANAVLLMLIVVFFGLTLWVLLK